MSAPASYQSVFRIAKQDGPNGSAPKATRRSRPPVSCTACRIRKLKCDRQQPCASCVRRDEAEGCSFTQGKVAASRNVKNSEARLRLQKLEEMVAGLVSTQPETPFNSGSGTSGSNGMVADQAGGPSSTSEHESPKFGSKAEPDPKYSGPTQWTQIIERIRDIQGALSVDDEEYEDEVEEEEPLVYPDGPSVLMDLDPQITVLDLCSSLPEKWVVDYLISDYMEKTHSCVLHGKKFARECEAFWADQSSVSFLWLSLFFSVCYIGSFLAENTVPSSAAGPPATTYLRRAGQALQAGRFQKGQTYSVEALLMYGIAKHVQKRDEPATEAWLVMGVAVRMAMRLGYHRDPKHFRNMTPFQMEMRRRTFHTVATFDLLLSYQAGLPALMNEEHTDCELPANLWDEDFDEDSETIRPGRPATEPTSMLYFCTKYSMSLILRRIMRHALTAAPQPYSKTLALDAEVRAYHATVPPSLRMSPAWQEGPERTALRRLHIEIMYLKSLCVLHRPYLSRDRRDPAYGHSRRTGVDAALRIMHLHAELDAANQPGQPFASHHWIMSSLTTHDFLLAAMIVCLDLVEQQQQQQQVNETPALDADPHRLNALRTAHRIWSSRRATSREARRASDVLGIMLAKLRGQSQGAAVPSPLRPAPSPTAVVSEMSLDQLLNEPTMLDWEEIDRCLLGTADGDFAFGFDWDGLDGIVAQDALAEPQAAAAAATTTTTTMTMYNGHVPT